ncbi:hypothetical protein [Jannaschia sp. R86511]|uniref:hypothetical protein n=1 Tax=Jannaschia sp. R86511 TaxID=3093853 RepID=UPI0036D3CBBE
MLAVAAAHRLGVVTTPRWPMVAAHLLVEADGGEHTAALAALSATDSAWHIDPLVPLVLEEIDAPVMTVDAAAEVVARLLALLDYPVARSLAALAESHDYPGGLIGDAYQAAEWLDCDCHEGTEERLVATRMQERFEKAPRLEIPAALAKALLSD